MGYKYTIQIYGIHDEYLGYTLSVYWGCQSFIIALYNLIKAKRFAKKKSFGLVQLECR